MLFLTLTHLFSLSTSFAGMEVTCKEQTYNQEPVPSSHAEHQHELPAESFCHSQMAGLVGSRVQPNSSLESFPNTA